MHPWVLIKINLPKNNLKVMLNLTLFIFVLCKVLWLCKASCMHQCTGLEISIRFFHAPWILPLCPVFHWFLVYLRLFLIIHTYTRVWLLPWIYLHVLHLGTRASRRSPSGMLGYVFWPTISRAEHPPAWFFLYCCKWIYWGGSGNVEWGADHSNTWVGEWGKGNREQQH